MSVHDGQRIGDLLRERGYESAPGPGEADVAVLTTCSVREKAHDKVLSAIGRLRRHKQRRPAMVVVVAGCVAQQEGRRLLETAPQVDLVVGPDHLWRVPDLIEEYLDAGVPRCVVGLEDPDHDRFLALTGARRPAPSAYLTIQKGCDQGCAFCIVPLVRGPGRCRAVEEILDEAAELARQGAREVVLLGQTVNSYRRDGTSFADLLRLIDEVPGIERVRYESAHPRFLSEELVEAHATIPSLCEHLHLPVQSGSDRVLGRMGRGHSRAEFLGWLDRIAALDRGIGITTDLFVGFPGETESDFQETLGLMEAARFDASFSFKYSPRPGTLAAGWRDDVPAAVKADRLGRLQELQARLTREHLEGLVGSEVEVLVEGQSKAGRGQLRGRTRRGAVVNIDGAGGEASLSGEAPFLPFASVPVGDIVKVKVTHAGNHSVKGHVLKDRTERGGV